MALLNELNAAGNIDINARDKVSSLQPNTKMQRTPLHYAAASGNLLAVQALIESEGIIIDAITIVRSFSLTLGRRNSPDESDLIWA